MNYIEKQKYIPVVRNYVQGATTEYTDLQNRLREDYDNTATQYDALQEAKDNMKFLSWKKDDVLAKNQIFQKATKEVEEAAKEGDYENRARLVRKAISNFKQRYAPILNNYEADIKQHEDLMKFDKIADPLERANVYNKLSRMYNNISDDDINYDTQGNVIPKSYQGFNAAADVNALEKALKIAEGWKANANTTIPYKVVGKDGTVTWRQKKIEMADENEIFNEAYKSLKSDPELRAYINQKNLVTDFDLNNFDKEGVELARQKYPDATDQQIGALLNEHKIIQEAANTAAKKSGYVKTDVDYKFDPDWEAGMKANAERKANAVTVITGSTSSDYKINLDGLSLIKNNLINDKNSLTKRLASATDPVAKEEIQNNLDNINTKLRLQDEILKNAEKAIEWNWGNSYADYAAETRKNGEQPIEPSKFKDIIKTSPQGDYTNTVLAGTYGINNARLLSNTRFKYSKAIDKANEEGSIIQNHEIVLGNESTYSGQYSKLLTDRLKDGNLELLTQGGNQFDINKDLPNVDINTVEIVPTKSLIGGKPGFAVTGKDKDDKTKKITHYVIMDDNTSNSEDYQQNGYDLLKQSNESKYTSSPDKKNQLKQTGLMQVGFSTEAGRKISNMNLPNIQGGTRKNPVKLPLTDKLEVQVITDAGVDIYRLYNKNTNSYITNPEDKRTNFRSEEDLMIALGTNTVAVNNPNLIK